MKLPGFDWAKTSAARAEEGDGWALLLGDSQRIVRELPPESVDALVVDPPYSSGGFVRGDRMKDTGDKYSRVDDNEPGGPGVLLADFEGDNRDQRSFLIWAQLWLWDARAAVRKGGVGFVFSDWRQLPVATDAFQLGGWVWRGLFVWDKLGAHRRAGFGRFSNRSEYGVWGSNGPLVYTIDPGEASRAGLDPEMLTGAFGCSPVPSQRRKHVAEKPAALMAYVARVVPSGGVVLDPFAGVGSTGIGALAAGRRFVGIELDAKAFDHAARRLERFEKKRRAA